MMRGVDQVENAAPREPIGRDRDSDRDGDRHLTAVALFEDAIDADAALRALERGASSAAQVSLLVRARSIEPDDVTDRSSAVARSLVATGLETVGGWLLGLASLLDRERGAYLIAGPFGAALFAVPTADAAPPAASATASDSLDSDSASSDPDAVVRVLAVFGFVAEEAAYLGNRVAAGAVLIAVTTTDPEPVTAVRQLFSDQNAVYIGQCQTASPQVTAATAALADLLRAAGINDDEPSLPPLRRVCRDPAGSNDLCGAAAVDRFGDDAGSIDDLVVDEFAAGGDTAPTVRYAIVEFGGILGLGRQHVAVPAALLDLRSRPVALAVERKVLHHAPRVAADGILTRRGQLAVCAYFGLWPYWLGGTGARGHGGEE